MAPITYHLSGTEGEGIHEDIIDTWAVRLAIVRLRKSMVINFKSIHYTDDQEQYDASNHFAC